MVCKGMPPSTSLQGHASLYFTPRACLPLLHSKGMPPSTSLQGHASLYFAPRDPLFVSVELLEDHKTVSTLRWIWPPSVLGISPDLKQRCQSVPSVQCDCHLVLNCLVLLSIPKETQAIGRFPTCLIHILNGMFNSHDLSIGFHSHPQPYLCLHE